MKEVVKQPGLIALMLAGGFAFLVGGLLKITPSTFSLVPADPDLHWHWILNYSLVMLLASPLKGAIGGLVLGWLLRGEYIFKKFVKIFIYSTILGMAVGAPFGAMTVFGITFLPYVLTAGLIGKFMNEKNGFSTLAFSCILTLIPGIVIFFIASGGYIFRDSMGSFSILSALDFCLGSGVGLGFWILNREKVNDKVPIG